MKASTLAQYRKWLVTIAGIAAMAVNVGLVNGTAAHVMDLVIPVITSFGVRQLKNAPAPATPAPPAA